MRVLAIDLETHLWRPGLMAPKPVCLSWAENEDSGLVHHTDIEIWCQKKFGRINEDGGLIIGHSVAYDMSCILEWYPNLSPLIWQLYTDGKIACTQVQEKLLQIVVGRPWFGKKPFSLAACVKRHLREDVTGKEGEDVWRMRYAELEDVPLAQWPKEAKRYAVDDSKYCLRVFFAQREAGQRYYYRFPDLSLQVRGDWALRLTSCWGVRTNRDRVNALLKSTQEDMAVLKTKLIGHGLMRDNGSKNLLALRDLVTRLASGEPDMSEKGNVKTDKEMLEKYHDPHIQDWQDYARLEKARNTYLIKLQHGFELPLHSYYNVLVASGRTSSRGPNMQNQPRLPGVRECFEARPGTVFVACDYDSQEMRCLAQVCQTRLGSSKLADRYREDPDFDPHLEFAAGMEGVSYEDALKDRKRFKTARQHAKIANFGLPGGMGPGGLVRYAKGYGVTLTHQEAFKLKKDWLQHWQMDDYFTHVLQCIETSTGYGSITQLGAGRVRGMCGYTDGCNTLFQGLAADASKSALFEVARKCYAVPKNPLYGCRPVIFIHDEIVLEVPEDRIHEAAQELKATMEEVQNHFTPDVPARASASAMKFWAKDAEAAFKDGKLVAWDA